MPHEPTGERATAREWAGLALLVLPMLTLTSDLSVLFFALPTLSADLDPSASQALWIVHVYGFLVAGFLVTMGRLGDRVGPRRLLLIGASAFAAVSAVAAFSTEAWMLIAARALLGVAGATLMPSLYSLLRIMFRDENQRRTAIAVVFGAFSAGGAVGPLLGGALLEFFWWGAIFLINVPPMALLVLAGPALLPEREERDAAPLDLTSVVLSVAGMLAVVYGLQELAAGQETGAGSAWPHVGVVAAGGLVLALFARRQRRIRDPLFDLALLADRRVGVPLAALLLCMIGTIGVFYLFTQYLQWAAGLSPFRAGLWTLPYILSNMVGALLGPPLAARLRPAAVVAGGLGAAAAGAVVLAVVAAPDAPLPLLAAVTAGIGLAGGPAMALMSDLIISGSPEEKTGSAAAAQEVGGELGSALGVAAAGAVALLAYRSSLDGAMPPGVPEAAAETALAGVHGGVAAAESLGAGGSALLAAVQGAVADGLQAYAAVAAVPSAAAAVLVAVLIARGGTREGAGAGEREREPLPGDRVTEAG